MLRFFWFGIMMCVSERVLYTEVYEGDKRCLRYRCQRGHKHYVMVEERWSRVVCDVYFALRTLRGFSGGVTSRQAQMAVGKYDLQSIREALQSLLRCGCVICFGDIGEKMWTATL